MAQVNVVRGNKFLESIQTANQSIGQLMTLVSNQKQLASIEKQQDQNIFDQNFMKNPALMAMNARERNPAFLAGLEKFHGLSGDGLDLWLKGISNMALLPKDQGTLEMMQGWKEMVEDNNPDRLINIGSSVKGAGLDLPEITDRLDKGFKPTTPVKKEEVGVAPGVTLQPVVTEEPKVEPEKEPVVKPQTEQLDTDDPTRPAGVVLPDEATVTPEIFKPIFDAGPQRDPLTGVIIKPPGEGITTGLEPPPGVVIPTVEEKAKTLEIDPTALDKSIREENLFRIQEQKRETLNLQIDNLQKQLQVIPREQRNSPQYLKGVDDLNKLKSQRDNVSLREQIKGKTSAFLRTGVNMSKFALGKEIDIPTEKYVREMEVIETKARENLEAENIIPGQEGAYLVNKVRGTLKDRQARDIITLLEKTPGILQQQEPFTPPPLLAPAERRKTFTPPPLLSPAERASGTAALRSLVNEAFPNTERENILRNLSKVDPAVLGEFFPTVFDRQLQLNDQEIRISQQRINSKIANTQQYQVMMQAYYQSAKDQMTANDPAAAIAFELSMMTLEVLAKGINWDDPKQAKKSWAAGLETIGLAKAGTVIAEDVFQSLGLKFKDIKLPRGFFGWLRGDDPLTLRALDTSSGPSGFVQDGVLGEGLFDPSKFIK